MNEYESRDINRNAYIISIRSELLTTPDSVKQLEEGYHIMKQAGQKDLPQYNEAIGSIIATVNETEPEVLIGAMTLARKLHLWELEPQVRQLQESQSEAIAHSADRAQIKREADIFLGFKRYHAQLARERVIAEKPYLVPPKVFQDVITDLDLAFTDE